MRKTYTLGLLSLFILLVLVACQSNNDTDESETNPQEETVETEAAASSEPADVDITEFGDEIGLSLTELSSEVETVLPIEGTIEQADELNDDYVWVTIQATNSIEEINNKQLEKYIPIENGKFKEDLNLHHGEGDYRVKVRIPSKDPDEENKFYDAANIQISNIDEEIVRDIEYTQYGIGKELTLSDSIKGWNQASEMLEIEGTVSDQYEGNVLLAEVEKEGEKNKVTIPIENGSFKGEVPLYFGKGTHSIQLQLYSDDEEDKEGTFYDAALLYVNNDSDKEFPEITQFGSYLESGMTLETPSWNIETEQDQIEYPIKGKIDKDAPLADTVSHVIVKVRHTDDRKDEATYFIPVEDYEFEGVTHFRFGPGEYEVTVHVPKEEQEKKNEFHFTPALSIKHEVSNIEDKRDILPSRGVESDHPIIIEKAEEITKGIKDDREKAKAIYEFVSKNVEYDVEKFEDDIFHPDDSALTTLDLGSGICQDYTFLTTALLRSIDIESRYVAGYAGGRHAWVEANIDGEWIEMDPTWGAGYVDGDEFHFKYNEDYFDPDPDFLEETHTRQELLY